MVVDSADLLVAQLQLLEDEAQERDLLGKARRQRAETLRAMGVGAEGGAAAEGAAEGAGEGEEEEEGEEE